MMNHTPLFLMSISLRRLMRLMHPPQQAPTR